MPITEKELRELIAINADIEKITTISSDGRNLLTRIPREIVDFLRIKKGAKIRWLVDVSTKEITLQIVKR